VNLLEMMLRAVAGLELPKITWDRLPVAFTAEGIASAFAP
jgi:hypothetical protein